MRQEGALVEDWMMQLKQAAGWLGAAAIGRLMHQGYQYQRGQGLPRWYLWLWELAIMVGMGMVGQLVWYVATLWLALPGQAMGPVIAVVAYGGPYWINRAFEAAAGLLKRKD